MSDYKDFVPKNAEEGQWVEKYNALSRYVSEKLKGIAKNDRLTALRASEPTDLSLMNLFLVSLKNEDYEICEVANQLLKERGLEFKSDTW
ncbi:hypothetical protein SAMN04487891_102461 [Flagellimonas taeanensis]|uniref:Uncharacterized protein n=2 Tax=Flagellimonas taeanensis TaxID=1005926 RepID=A0A1M6SI15_9FLAO|nr:hypothetical protein SAMN04487891_102461 [Allomuricauda taeanensis]SHK44434.1 hypothetical protein SAMN05216293_1142 [Allomuricauda taeanensis]